MPKTSIECRCGNRQWYDGDRETINCKECHTTIHVHRGLVRRISDYDAVEQLAAGPSTGLNRSQFPNEIRGMVHTLTVGGVQDVRPVYYLEGDIREAMRVFIRENEDWIRTHVAGNNRLSQEWPDWMLELLFEQWYFMGMPE